MNKGRSLLADDHPQQSAENDGSLTDEAAASFSELFGEGIAGSSDGGVKKHHHHSVEHMAGAENLDLANMPMDLDGSAGGWHERYHIL